MGHIKINIYCYANDGFLQILLLNFNTAAKIFNMSTNKTKRTMIAKEPIIYELKVERKMMEQIINSSQFRINIFSNRQLKEDTQRRTIKAA